MGSFQWSLAAQFVAGQIGHAVAVNYHVFHTMETSLQKRPIFSSPDSKWSQFPGVYRDQRMGQKQVHNGAFVISSGFEQF
jgi:hypothetical protein